MNVYDAIMTRRTIRKFTPEKVSRETLVKLVKLASMAAFGANLQPLKFKIIDDDLCAEIFPYIKWAAYLPDGAPKSGEEPQAYIAVLGDKLIKPQFECDAGAAITNMMLGAVEEGLATCWLGAINRDAISEILNLPQSLQLLYLLAVGYPAQTSRAIDITDSVKYFEDSSGAINVPKRKLEDILL